MRIWFASGNEHKKAEMEKLLGGYDLILPKEAGIEFNPEENGDDFASNSLIKAEALWNIVHEPVLADDSGLCVKALGWKPGVHTARYGEEEAGRKLSDREKYMLLLKNIEGIDDREACFVTSLTLILSPFRRYMIQETCEGTIALTPSGTNGFGYDPIFKVKEAGGVIAAELDGDSKNLYSHRGKAARRLRLLIDSEV